MLARQHLLSEEEVGAGFCLPQQRRVTAHIMDNWKPHLNAQPPSRRCQDLRMLHREVSVNASSRVPEDSPGHSILQHDMPDDEDPNCEDAKKKKLSHCPAAHPSCLFLGKARTVISEKDWQSWFCQFLGVPIPALGPFWKEQRVCACGRHVIDEYGDHVHACKQHTSSTKSAHETILDAVEALCHQAGLSTERRNIPTVKKQNGKTGQGDLVIKGANIGGDTNLIIDVALIHEFGGNHMVDVSLNGKLRHAQPDKLLESAARTKVHRYREAYATRSGITYAFLPCVMSTSGRIHGEFLRFLYILAHRRTKGWFERLGYEPSEEAFKFRRGQYFWHTRAAIGHATALAVARRARVAEHALRRNRPRLHTHDDLLYPPTAPVAF